MKEFVDSHTGLYYRVNDFQANRPTLVFVHGLTGSSSAWEKYEKKFENDYNILTFDLRGHGKSLRYKKYKEYGVGKFADDINHLITRVGIKKCILISHSFGTILALEFLRKYPGLAISAVFLSPIHGLSKPWWSPLIRFITDLLIRFFNFLPLYKTTGKHIDYNLFPNSGDWDMRRLIADLRNTSLRIYVYCLKHIYTYHHDNFWKELLIPVTVIHGTKDTISPYKNAEGIVKMVSDAKLVSLGNANHIIVLNCFNEVSEVMGNIARETE